MDSDTTQSRKDTARGASFPYQFGLDFFQRKVVAYNTVENKVATFLPADLQRLAADKTQHPHLHALYQAGWDYWLSHNGGES